VSRFSKALAVCRIGGEEHETEIGLRRDHRKHQELTVFGGADFLDEFAQGGSLRRGVRRHREAAMAVFDLIKEVQDVPAFGGDDR
jgi:hypothetical protein